MDAALARQISEEGPVVFYDGECGLCDRSVQILIRLDRGQRLRYATLQGETAQRLLGEPVGEPGSWSVKLLQGGRLYDRSTAALRAAIAAGGAGKLGWVFLLIPTFVRDGVYRWIARNRKRWFGGSEACLLPTQALREKFLP